MKSRKKELQRSRVKYFIYLQTTMPQNLPEFQKSIGKELLTIKDRVRNLIGNAHRGEEGRYKESVLKKVIREYLPNNLSIWTWFIISKNDTRNYISKQIDILIYDNAYPVIFRDEDFVIITQDMVRGIIEVKTKTNSSGNNELKKIINKFWRLENFEILKNEIRNNNIFSWIFSYETEITEPQLTDSNKYTWIQLKYVNHISLWNNFFFKSWRSNWNIHPQANLGVNWDSPFFNIYKIEDYSFGYFLSNLLHIISWKKLNERSPFSFTIPDPYGKEGYKIWSIQISN